MRPHLLCCLALSACLPAPSVDAVGPRLQRFELEGRGQALAGRRVSVRPTIELSFDGALEPRSVHSGTLSLRRLAGDEPCAGVLPCETGRCIDGRCLSSSLSEGELDDLLDGEYAREPGDLDEAELELQLLDGAEGSNHRLRIRPRRALWGDARYELVIGGLRDLAGNPLRRWVEEGEPHRFEFSTRKTGSSGVEGHLHSPEAGAREVPTNLAVIELRYRVPVGTAPEELAQAWAKLESESGETVALGSAEACATRPPGSCLRWRPQAELMPHTRYRLGSSSLVDEAGRGSALPADADWFETGEGPDEVPPVLEVHGWARAHCQHLGLVAAEPLALRWSVGGRELRHEAVGWFEFGVPVRPEHPELPWSLEAKDAAGNEEEAAGVLAVETSAAPPLVITEVLANPLGSEPKAEFVELASTRDEPQSTEGLYLADQSWPELRAALEAGEEPPGDPLPAVELGPREVVLVVADDYPGESELEDRPPPPTTRLLPIGSSLGEGGLKNAGEALVLYRAEPPELLSSYGNWIATDASEYGGVSVERISTEACDGPGDWRANLAQGATPGRLP